MVQSDRASGGNARGPESFGVIYERNAINNAFPILIAKDLIDNIDDSDLVEVDFNSGKIVNLSKGKTYFAKPFSKSQLDIYKRGGLLN